MKRLSYLAVMAAAGALISATVPVTAQAEETLTFVSWGGAMQEANRKAHWEPAAKAMGFTYTEDTQSDTYPQVKVQVDAGAVTWDVVQMGAGTAMRGGDDGIFEKIDYSVVTSAADVPNSLKNDYCIGTITYSTMIAWNTDTYGANGPQSWADFWDVEKFPGTRSMSANPNHNLEFALMADGVPVDKVYEVLSSPGGIERAIDKMREIKPHVAVWWKSGAQHAQLMKDGEVDMTTGWNGRFSTAIKDGAHADYTYNQAVLDFDCYAIPKGSPNKDLAMRVINEITKPEYQANLTKYINYGPTNTKAYEIGIITPEVARTLPSYPANAKVQLVFNPDWWRENEARAVELFDEMMIE